MRRRLGVPRRAKTLRDRFLKVHVLRFADLTSSVGFFDHVSFRWGEDITAERSRLIIAVFHRIEQAAFSLPLESKTGD